MKDSRQLHTHCNLPIDALAKQGETMDGDDHLDSHKNVATSEQAAEAAARLEKRARRARNTFLRIGLLIFMVIYALAGYGLLRYLEADKTKPGPTPAAQLDAQMSGRITALIATQTMRPDTPDQLQDQRATASQKKINEVLDEWERVKRIEGIERAQQSSLTQWLPVVIQGVIVFGLLAFVGFAIQIGLMFMRYYARLAELYDTQVDALNLSRGDILLATQFMEKFSPNGIGTPPIP